MSINICDLCYDLVGEACYSSLFIEAGLSATSDYTVHIEDKHEHSYTQDITTDDQGDITLDLTLFPDGMFTAFSGSYIVTVTQVGETAVESIIVDGQDYSCVKLVFQEVN